MRSALTVGSLCGRRSNGGPTPRRAWETQPGPGAEGTPPACPVGSLNHQQAAPLTTMVYVDDTPADRERLMLLASDEPTTLDNDRAA